MEGQPQSSHLAQNKPLSPPCAAPLVEPRQPDLAALVIVQNLLLCINEHYVSLNHFNHGIRLLAK